jgi:hypothetical protein
VQREDETYAGKWNVNPINVERGAQNPAFKHPSTLQMKYINKSPSWLRPYQI